LNSVGGENLKGKYRLEDEGVVVTITLKCSLKKQDGGHVIWIHLAQNGKNSCAVSNTAINLDP
jgi:hypothetical protein